jgi:hypothetical protein
MKRRTLLSALAAVTLGGCTEAIDGTPIDISDGEGNEKLAVSGDISRVEWIDDQKWLEIYFNGEHDTEAVWLTHSADSNILYITDAPRFEGPIEIPLLDSIACDDANYPSATFEITAAEGRPLPGFTPETTGEAEIPLPDGYLDRLSESEYYEGDEAEAYCMAIEQGSHPDDGPSAGDDTSNGTVNPL